MTVTVKPLVPERLDDFFHFFDRVAFIDNPEWASCYCYYFHIACSEAEWAKRSGAENREKTREGVLSGTTAGYLAYLDESPVGWCNANDKRNYARLAADKSLPSDPREKVGSIVCFVIGPQYRRRGIARRLLEEACAGFEKKGYACSEAYPRRGASSDAQHYHGPLSMYLKAGFKVHREFPDFLIVRKEFGKAR
jgi:ribosomal protein S18 acetylase RimI-like enzyme